MSKSRITAPCPEASFQFRVTVDPAMGEVYDWLASLNSYQRSRELLYLIRLGFALTRGASQFPSPGLPLAPMGALATDAPGGSPAATAAAGGDLPVRSGRARSAAEAAREQVEALDANWDIVAMCTPPPPEAMQRH
jgi:hypothetical protein